MENFRQYPKYSFKEKDNLIYKRLDPTSKSVIVDLHFLTEQGFLVAIRFSKDKIAKLIPQLQETLEEIRINEEKLEREKFWEKGGIKEGRLMVGFANCQKCGAEYQLYVKYNEDGIAEEYGDCPNGCKDEKNNTELIFEGKYIFDPIRQFWNLRLFCKCGGEYNSLKELREHWKLDHKEDTQKWQNLSEELNINIKELGDE